MAKRDRDTDIWKDKFYRGLPPLYKCFWDYINDECDNAGVWIEDLATAKLRIGKRVDRAKAIDLFGDRIQIFDSGNKWHIKTFVFEKLGFNELNPNHKFQKSIIELLAKHKIDKIKGYPDTLQSVKEREREGQEQGKERDKGGVGENLTPALVTLDGALSEIEQWTNEVIQGNDPQFTSMVRDVGANGQLETLARDHLGLCARYKWHEKIDTQQAFRLSLIGHITREIKKQPNGTGAKGISGQGGPEPGKDYREGF